MRSAIMTLCSEEATAQCGAMRSFSALTLALIGAVFFPWASLWLACCFFAIAAFSPFVACAERNALMVLCKNK